MQYINISILKAGGNRRWYRTVEFFFDEIFDNIVWNFKIDRLPVLAALTVRMRALVLLSKNSIMFVSRINEPIPGMFGLFECILQNLLHFGLEVKVFHLCNPWYCHLLPFGLIQCEVTQILWCCVKWFFHLLPVFLCFQYS